MTRLKKLRLEDYIDFFNDPSAQILCMGQLHEIVKMHGFFRLRTKTESVEALKAVSLMSPTRSTVGYRNRAAFPCALLTVEEVRDDVRRIGWEECPFGSILTVGSLADREAAVEEDFRRPISSEWGRTKRRRTRKRRRMLLPTTAALNGRR